MSKQCMPLWPEAHWEVNMLKALHALKSKVSKTEGLSHFRCSDVAMLKDRWINNWKERQIERERDRQIDR